MLLVAKTRSSKHCAQLKARRKQYRCLEPNHFYIFIKTYILLLLKIHINLLAFTNLLCRFIKYFKYLVHVIDTYFINAFICGYKHYITRKQCCWFTIFCMDSLHTPAQWSFVHDIIMYQRKIVE